MLRFRYVTDAIQNNGGWYIDDIYPVEWFSTSAMLTDADADTTLFVTNLGLGDFYYKVRAKDAQNQYSSFSPLVVAHVYYSDSVSVEGS